MKKLTMLCCALFFSQMGGLLGIQPAAFDTARVEKEIEIMKSILSTTLSFVRQDAFEELSDSGLEMSELEALGHGNDSQIEGFYLFEQGTLLRISLPRLPSNETKKLAALESKLARVKRGLDKDLHLAGAQLHLLEHELNLVYEDFSEYSAALDKFSDLVDYAAELEHADSPEGREEWEKKVQQKVEKYQSELKTQKARMQELERKADQYRESVKQALIEAIANHGDSLSHLKPDEYLNLMLVEDSGHPWELGPEESKPGSTVLSVKKSDISAYRSGNVDLTQFGARVMEY